MPTIASVTTWDVPAEAKRSALYSTPSKVAAEVLPALMAMTNLSFGEIPPELELLELDELLEEELLELDELLEDVELEELEEDELELLDEVRPEPEELELDELLEPEAVPSGPEHALINRQVNKLVNNGLCIAQSQHG